MTIEWLLPLQQLQPAFMQSIACLWLHVLHVHMLSKEIASLPLVVASIIFHSSSYNLRI
jgi:hypothetical protein